MATPRVPSRSASIASTVNYGPSREPSKEVESKNVSRQPSLASTVNYGPSREPSKDIDTETRSRSRGRHLLPVTEEPTRKETVKKVLQQMQQASASDSKTQASIRLQLSKFAKSVAPQARQARTNERASTQAPKRAKSFDEIAAEAEIMEQAVPYGAATQRQKTGPSIPDWQKRFQGKLVRPTSR